MIRLWRLRCQSAPYCHGEHFIEEIMSVIGTITEKPPKSKRSLQIVKQTTARISKRSWVVIHNELYRWDMILTTSHLRRWSKLWGNLLVLLPSNSAKGSPLGDLGKTQVANTHSLGTQGKIRNKHPKKLSDFKVNFQKAWTRWPVFAVLVYIIYMITYMATLHATDSALVRPLVLTLHNPT